MGYTAGNLDLSIVGLDKDAISSINKVVKSLGKLQTALGTISFDNLTSLSQSFNQIGTALSSISMDGVKAFGSLGTYLSTFAKKLKEIDFKSLSEGLSGIAPQINALSEALKPLADISFKPLSSLGTVFTNFSKKLTGINWSEFEKGFERITKSITPFLDKIKEAGTELNSLQDILKRLNIDESGSGKKRRKSKDGIFGALKLTTTLYLARSLAGVVGNIVQAGSDYNETLNLWQVAMRDNLDLADQFVTKMNKAYGISTKTVMEAQAVFKNMIGSLGQISDETAYALSEALVQMSADYASLYNRTLESAIQNMQSMLAGQVRPIRSAGLDITETTLFMFYQQLGGTKTMRQLTRTEKHLLSILAVYQQMDKAGALGDMTKTLNTFANQSRMMTEYWVELKTWTGLVLKDLIEQSGALIYINAALITMSEIMKAIAKSRGLGEENYLTGLFETTDATNDAVDELQGKLLDFDKFRALEDSQTNALGIDEKLLEAITGYSSEIAKARNEAQELAKEWMIALGWTVSLNGQLEITDENLSNIKNTLTAVGIALGFIIGVKTFDSIISLFKAIFNLKNSFTLLESAIIGGAIYAILKAIEAFENGDIKTGILATAIGVTLVSAFILLNLWLLNTKFNLSGVALSIGRVFANVSILVGGIALLTAGVTSFISSWDKMSGLGKWIGLIISLTAAITAFGVALHATQGNWFFALGLGAAVTGAGLMVTTQLASIKEYANGGMPDKGTLFFAGEAGAEIVTNSSNGQTGVTNVQQIAQAMRIGTLQAVKEWWSSARNDIPQFKEVSKTGIYEVAKSEMRRRGEW